jgi:hypothetical protein
MKRSLPLLLIPLLFSLRALGQASVVNSSGFNVPGPIEVEGTPAAAPVSVQGSADGGLPVAVVGSVTATVAGGTVQGTTAGVPVVVQGAADGGLPLSANVQGMTGGVPQSIQGSADGGIPVAVTGSVTATVAAATVQGTTAGVPVVVQGAADGGLPISITGTVTATVAAATVQGTTAGVPVVVQGAADGGLPIAIAGGATIQGTIAGVPISIQGAKDGGLPVGVVDVGGTVQGTAAGVPISIQGAADGGFPIAIAGGATIQGTTSGVPVVVQGAADGGLPISTTDAVDAVIDAGLGTKGAVVQGLVVANGTTPTASAAGFSNVPTMSQDNRLYANIGPANPIHYYESTSSEALVVVAPAAGTSYYVTDLTLSCGTTAQEVKLLDCDAGSIVTYEDIYCAANGGMTHTYVSPIRVVAGKSVCCDPVGGTTATCTTTGYVAP